MDTKRKRAESRKDMIVTTVAMPIDMHRRLAQLALDRRTVMTEMVRQAVTEWLERQEKPAKAGRNGR